MDHEAMHEKIFEYYDGALDEAARQGVEAHLAACAACRAALAEWQRAAQICFRATEPAASEAFVRRVMSGIAPEATVARQAWVPRWVLDTGWLVPAFGLALALMAVLPGAAPQGVSVESLLLQNGREPAVVRHVIRGEQPSEREFLEFVMGEDVS